MSQLPTTAQASRRFDLSQQFTALHKISVALSRSLDLGQTLEAMIQALYEHAYMQYGMVCLFDKTRSALFIEALYGADTEVVKGCKNVRYRIGEGILGTVMSQQRSLVLPRVSDDPRFLDRLNLYDYGLPFICVPIPGPDGVPLGVLAAQPMELHEDRLPASTRFLEMVANLICQTVRLVGHMSVETEALRQERDTLRRKVKHQYGFDNMVGNSQPMRQIFDVIRQVSKWDTTVLVRGESGTGKELIANAIHYNSPRTLEPFVKFNCAALPDNLLESELFGHEKGAFTGAVRQRKGRFELADGGTLFLDEIGESSASFQAKLLRILQEGEMERVGGDTTIKVNVRIIAATNRNLEEEVRAGHFREDLYYRLNVMPINLPPLRERQDDIVGLSQFLIAKLAAKQGRELRISDGALRLLMGYSWPGNVRELENCLERASVMSEEGLIDRDVILFNHSETSAMAPQGLPRGVAPPAHLDAPGDSDMDDRQKLIAALEKSGWVQAKAARLLGMTPRQVAYRIQILNINMHRL
ncbi:nif-specific transcriptional activator NifA [Acerihabitans arboris]|uniref:Nif-specific regulatory protein n=1 Tax=Acerihabitans arboris TaxID=2691583 RepID=A0A845SHW6_9GAMM|nr:nif-specific transcriptional activator NifA [Acerihabitans arboris]NDL62972.1 nif-specific transcriptional activator NifA [Acerihabitans arboris]